MAFTALKLVVALVNFATFLAGIFRDNGLIKQGEDAAIARAAADLFKKTQHAKVVREKIDAMSEAEVDALLVGFELADDVHNDKGRGG